MKKSKNYKSEKKSRPFNKYFLIFVLILILLGVMLIAFKINIDSNINKADSKVLRVDTVGYLDYSQRNLETAKLKGTPILFFAATKWCQTCAMLEKEILERLSEIPADVMILKVDYDNDKEMNKKWFVLQQHTLVVLDSNGEEITRWVGGDMNQLLDELNNY